MPVKEIKIIFRMVLEIIILINSPRIRISFQIIIIIKINILATAITHLKEILNSLANKDFNSNNNNSPNPRSSKAILIK